MPSGRNEKTGRLNPKVNGEWNEKAASRIRIGRAANRANNRAGRTVTVVALRSVSAVAKAGQWLQEDVLPIVARAARPGKRGKWTRAGRATSAGLRDVPGRVAPVSREDPRVTWARVGIKAIPLASGLKGDARRLLRRGPEATGSPVFRTSVRTVERLCAPHLECPASMISVTG